jgi:hypothetical protein
MAPGRGRGHLCWWPLIFKKNFLIRNTFNQLKLYLKYFRDTFFDLYFIGSVGFGGGCCSCAYQQMVKNMQKFFFISIHKPPASIRFAPIKHALAVTVEPFKFSPA